jgi:hypothetical protein
MKCLKLAELSGLCVTHEKVARRDPRGERYHEAIDAVLDACRTKGWTARLDNRDDGHRLATINVTKSFYYDKVTGLVHLTVDDAVMCSIEKTSFHGYGQQDLLEAIRYKLGDLPWLESKGAETERAKRQAQEIERAKQQESHTAILIKRVLANFDKAARQLRRRYDDRTPYTIADEYDVQDLLHAILRAYFDAVSPRNIRLAMLDRHPESTSF